MLDLLKEELMEYYKKFEANKKECIQLMKENKPWQEKAKEGASLRVMIETIILEMKKYA